MKIILFLLLLLSLLVLSPQLLLAFRPSSTSSTRSKNNKNNKIQSSSSSLCFIISEKRQQQRQRRRWQRQHKHYFSSQHHSETFGEKNYCQHYQSQQSQLFYYSQNNKKCGLLLCWRQQQRRRRQLIIHNGRSKSNEIINEKQKKTRLFLSNSSSSEDDDDDDDVILEEDADDLYRNNPNNRLQNLNNNLNNNNNNNNNVVVQKKEEEELLMKQNNNNDEEIINTNKHIIADIIEEKLLEYYHEKTQECINKLINYEENDNNNENDEQISLSLLLSSSCNDLSIIDNIIKQYINQEETNFPNRDDTMLSIAKKQIMSSLPKSNFPSEEEEENEEENVEKELIEQMIVSSQNNQGNNNENENDNEISTSRTITSTSTSSSTRSTAVSLDVVKEFINNIILLESSIIKLKGVGPKTYDILSKKLNLLTIKDLLFYFPTSFIDRTILPNGITYTHTHTHTTSSGNGNENDYTGSNNPLVGNIVSLIITIDSMYDITTNTGKNILKVNCYDENKNLIVVTFFTGMSKSIRSKMAYKSKMGKKGDERYISGKLLYNVEYNHYEIIQPDIISTIDNDDDDNDNDIPSSTNNMNIIEPNYKLTNGITQNKIRTIIKQALDIGINTLNLIPELPLVLLSSTSSNSNSNSNNNTSTTTTTSTSTTTTNILDTLNWPSITLSNSLLLSHYPKSMKDIIGQVEQQQQQQDGTITGTTTISSQSIISTMDSRMRLSFEELCIQQSNLALLRHSYKYPYYSYPYSASSIISTTTTTINEDEQQYRPLLYNYTWKESPIVSLAISLLPFTLTSSQEKCLNEIWNDSILNNNNNDDNSHEHQQQQLMQMQSSRMERLLQGDVSSGKTVLAYLIGLGCLELRASLSLSSSSSRTGDGSGGGGNVVAILAPTTILANQHYRSLSIFVEKMNEQLKKQRTTSTTSTDQKHKHNNNNRNIECIKVKLITGSITGSKRDDILRQLEESSSNEAFFLIGTHALITPDVANRLSNLGQLSSSMNNNTYSVVGRHHHHHRRCGLALAVVDEEQRFGVAQRNILSRCAEHTLAMTATPIPRTLAIGGYSKNSKFHVRTGFMDVTILDEKPPGVQTPRTSIVMSEKIHDVIQAIITQLDENNAKVFWVLPRIGNNNNNETSETTASDVLIDNNNNNNNNDDGRSIINDEKNEINSGNNNGDNNNEILLATSVMQRYEELTTLIGKDRVGFIHGRMASDEREEQLRQFANCTSQVDIMVGTTVLEVGVDIPYVNILVVEGAENFGLSQLHQLRGRIGRSVIKKEKKDDDASDTTTSSSSSSEDDEKLKETRREEDTSNCHCILLTKSTDFDVLKRLDVLRKTNDGAKVAMADFNLRGPGELVGLRQSGVKNGYAIDLSSHYDLVDAAAVLGRSFIENDVTEIGLKWATDSKANIITHTLMRVLASQKARDFFNEHAASTPGGFRLRAGLSFFGNWKSTVPQNNAHSSLSNLFKFREMLSETPDNNDAKIDDLFASLTDEIGSYKPDDAELIIPEERTPKKSTAESPASLQSSRALVNGQSRNDKDFQEPSQSPVYLIIDTETTGLSSESYVIQIAAKVLGSDDPKDAFIAYCRPPVSLDKTIEDLTGITNDFLINGGVDRATGEIISGSAPTFSVVYDKFCSFCNRIRKGNNIVMIAHNAPFDVRMLNGEVKRLAAQARSDGKAGSDVPWFTRDTSIVSAIDTLRLSKLKPSWKGDRNSRINKLPSYSLTSIYQHIFSDTFDAHNAYADVLGLERILLSQEMNGWEITGKRIATPLSFPEQR